MPMAQLVTTEWLAKETGASDLRIIDATAFMPGDARDPSEEFAKSHIPGAVFLNLPGLADTDNPVPNMLPSAERFASRMRELGIGDGSRIVIYDNSGFATAARAWWMFTIYGVNDVALLDGNMAKWQAEGRDIATGDADIRSRHFTAWKDTARVRSKQDMLANLDSRAEQVIDARPANRFDGSTPEPREGMAAGHIPGSINIPFAKLFREDGTWKQPEELRALFIEAGAAMDGPVITSCGSGITAAALLFALKLIGKNDVSLYDGSWSEWGLDPDTPKVQGTA